MKRLIVVVTIMLSGCMTYGELQDRSPALTYQSAKAPDVYLGCVAPRFIDIHPNSTTVRDGDTWVVTLPSEGAVMGTVTISQDGEGSRVEYRQMHDLEWGSFGRARQAVSDCL